MTEETLVLRDAARRLARIKNPEATKIEASELLGLLRSGALKAGFYFLNGKSWIEIPLTHWEATGSNSFRRIGVKQDDPKSGTYKIRANRFPDQVASIICKEVGATEHTPSHS
jgi:hypothetical protein